MNPKVTVHPEAEAEILQTLAWYNDRSRLAGRAFVQELGHVIRLAAQAPKSWPSTFAGTRRVVFPRFPFDLIFRPTREGIEIVALAHHRRRPYYWQNR